MMNLKLGSLLLLFLLVALVGCDSARDAVLDTTQSSNPVIGDATADVEASPIKLLWLINYPRGGKDAYLEWVASVSPTLAAPAELKRIASYDNYYGENPHRLVEFEFGSFVDAMTYLNRPDIAAVLEALPDYSSESRTYTFIQRSDYSKVLDTNRAIKSIYLIDYPLGGKDEYLTWVETKALALIAPDELKRIASYDNYYGESPHRLVELEFDSMEEANRYQILEGPRGVSAELPNQAGRVTMHVFELRGDYVNLNQSVE